MYEFDKTQYQKIQALRGMGVEPYPNGLDISTRIAFLISNNELTLVDLEESESEYQVAGRLRFKNEMGRIGFGRIEDESGKIQISIKKNDVEELCFKTWKKLDVGDWVWIRGTLSRTRTGELTLFASELRLYSKCMEGMPDKQVGLVDPETKQRMRYLDLIVNEDSRKVFRTRSTLVSCVKDFLTRRDFMEVETPMLQSIPGGASARPFETHHNALNQEMYLRIAPELFLKRLLVGGFERVFELNRNFRNEGVSAKHNPEFTMVEFYQAHATYKDLIKTLRELLMSLAVQALSCGYGRTESTDEALWQPIFQFGDNEINFYKVTEVRFEDLISDLGYEGNEINDPWDIEQLREWYLNQRAASFLLPLSLEAEESLPKTIGGWFTFLFDSYIENSLINPTFVTHYPTEISPLARKNEENPLVTDRFELFIAGQEVANGFSELNDPIDQAERFMEQARLKAGGDKEAMFFDEDYIRALSFGMPPAAGAGVGIDRLVMILTGSKSIRDVILFPTLRRRE
jgi:lysyl-tRNA synthetase, class II